MGFPALLLANESLLPTGRAIDGGWLTPFACRIVIEPSGRALRSAGKADPLLSYLYRRLPQTRVESSVRATPSLQHLTTAVREALAKEAWYPALSLALTLPDICAYIEHGHDNPVFRKSSERRYVNWFDRFLAADFSAKVGRDTTPTQFLTGADCYALRCSFLHQGADDISAQRARSVLNRFIFIAGSTRSHMNRINLSLADAPAVTILQLHVIPFCETVCRAVETWGGTIGESAAAASRADTLLSIHTETFSFMGMQFRVN